MTHLNLSVKTTKSLESAVREPELTIAAMLMLQPVGHRYNSIRLIFDGFLNKQVGVRGQVKLPRHKIVPCQLIHQLALICRTLMSAVCLFRAVAMATLKFKDPSPYVKGPQGAPSVDYLYAR